MGRTCAASPAEGMGVMRRKFVSAVIIVVVLVVAACQRPVAGPDDQTPGPLVRSTCGVGPKLVPKCGAWWGVAANPLGGETWDQALVNYESRIGRTVNIAHFYHRAGQLFPTRQEIARANEPGKERLLLLNYKPESGHTWREVGRGATNAEIDRLAAYIKANFTKPFFFTVHHEPEDEVRQIGGSGYTAQDYVLMYRHVMLRLHQRGLRNIVRVMNYMGLPKWGSQSWFNALYPGDDVVDWIALDPYIFGTGTYWGGVPDLMNRRFSEYPSWPGFYTWATRNHPTKPLMLGEWGVSERAGSPGAKANFFRMLGSEVQQWPRVKALVYWNAAGDRTVGATRVDSSTPSWNEYARIGRLPYFNR
jgi:hypothetical protein